MTRTEAYFSALKYYFQNRVVAGYPIREAYRIARHKAAWYAFSVKAENLTTYVTL